MMKKLLERSLFPRHAAINLAVIRVLVGSFAIWSLIAGRYDLLISCIKSDPAHFRPVGVVSLLSGPLSEPVYRAIYETCTVLSVLFTLGVASRVIAPLFAILYWFALSYRQSWGFVYHTHNLPVLHIAVLSLAPSAATLSIDALLRRFDLGPLRAVLAKPPGLPSWRYGWPVQLIILLTGIAYWVAGMAKLGNAGTAWATDAHLLHQIGDNALRYQFLEGGAKPITFVVYSWPIWVWVALGTLSLCCELGAPLAILHERLALLIAFALFCFHWGILTLMGIPFVYQLYGVAYAPFVRWDRLSRWLRRTIRKPRRRASVGARRAQAPS